ncbi:MAG: hypothetical protein JW917_03540 [Ignavibacteria bacterium]|nr:hypothetical protein [Ignavibacteria bacterium]
MTKLEEHKELEKKIVKGFKLAHKKMIKEKIKNDEYVIVSINGKIVRKKARDIFGKNVKNK